MIDFHFQKLTLFSFGSIIALALICGIFVPTTVNPSYDPNITSDVSVSTGIKNSVTQYVDHEPIIVIGDN